MVQGRHVLLRMMGGGSFPCCSHPHMLQRQVTHVPPENDSMARCALELTSARRNTTASRRAIRMPQPETVNTIVPC